MRTLFHEEDKTWNSITGLVKELAFECFLEFKIAAGMLFKM